NNLLAILLLSFIFSYAYGIQLAVKVPNGVKCLFVEYTPVNGITNTIGAPFLMDLVDTEGYYHFGDAIPVQESLSYTILAYSDVPANGYCGGNCVAIIKNFNPSDYYMKNDPLKLDIGFFTNCNAYYTQLAVQVPTGARCMQAVFDNTYYTSTRILYVDLVDEQGYFHFSNIVPVQIISSYQFWAYAGFPNVQNKTDPTDDSCFGWCMGAARSLVPTNDIISSSLWKIDQ
ncbi:9784_t:CDS:1, partial [Racocetra fulgida]